MDDPLSPGTSRDHSRVTDSGRHNKIDDTVACIRFENVKHEKGCVIEDQKKGRMHIEESAARKASGEGYDEPLPAKSGPGSMKFLFRTGEADDVIH